MKLGIEIGLGPGHIVLDGDPGPPEVEQSPIVGQSLLWPFNGRLFQLLLSTCCLFGQIIVSL